ncbi:MAG: hypothetical protein IPJ20_23555 [Flammeovirgaceae bacterium]|nr:hypothetical protein [Flammeovirgaceae bacterium]
MSTTNVKDTIISRVTHIWNLCKVLIPKGVSHEIGITNTLKITVRIKVAAIDKKKSKSWSDYKKQKISTSNAVDLTMNEFDKNEWRW